MLEQENAFYKAHQAEFREKYLDKWLVIIGESLFGAYDKFADAAQAAMEQLGQSEFMIHRPSDDGKVVQIGPRVRAKYPDDAKRPKPKAVITCAGGPLTVTYPY